MHRSATAFGPSSGKATANSSGTRCHALVVGPHALPLLSELEGVQKQTLMQYNYHYIALRYWTELSLKVPGVDLPSTVDSDGWWWRLAFWKQVEACRYEVFIESKGLFDLSVSHNDEADRIGQTEVLISKRVKDLLCISLHTCI